ncbi:hypothetical protein AVEN_248624-1 [Araneus ventricosus]|uniref:Uncharacterized protein n=1 Tax=Araneus ventricosus TaxID=182803 RepID=A0A4Y2WD16_ARAVE|nr:hypothetical protein AVEN_261508-1 [Araneus ventricosus]GBO35174.1 hypothetical protein AVEN_248624-1 [Araneus ventricosus]
MRTLPSHFVIKQTGGPLQSFNLLDLIKHKRLLDSSVMKENQEVFDYDWADTAASKYYKSSTSKFVSKKMDIFTRVVLSLTVLFSMCDVISGHEGRHKGHSHHLPEKDGPKNVLKDKKYLRDYE